MNQWVRRTWPGDWRASAPIGDSMGVPAPPRKPIEASIGDLRRAAEEHKALLEKLDKRAFINKYGKTIGKMLKPRQCTRCQTAFTLADSIGAWQCRMHPGQLVEGRWNCCGQFAGPLDRLHVALKFHIDPGSASGCTPVDHTYMYLSNDGVGDGRGVWRVPPELRRLLLYKPFRAIEPPHSDAWRFSAIWNARSSKEAGSSSLSVTEHVPDATEMEAAIRSGSCIARSSARYDEIGAKSIYAGYKSSDVEERRRSKSKHRAIFSSPPARLRSGIASGSESTRS